MDEAKYSLCLTHQKKLGHPSPSLVHHPAGMDDFGMCNLNDHIQAIDLKIVGRSTQAKPCKLCLVRPTRKPFWCRKMCVLPCCELGGELRKL